MHIERQGQVLTKKIACLDSAFKGLDSLALVSAIKGQRLDGAIFFISTALPFYNVLLKCTKTFHISCNMRSKYKMNTVEGF